MTVGQRDKKYIFFEYQKKQTNYHRILSLRPLSNHTFIEPGRIPGPFL